MNRQPQRPGHPVPVEGSICRNDRGQEHPLIAPARDEELIRVQSWLQKHDDLPELIGDAVEDAIFYILDGWRTHRFDFDDDKVDSDERRSLGTKLQFHVIDNLHLMKMRHPDTRIEDVGVEIKGTVRDNWAIPKEGQCGVTLLIQINTAAGRQRSSLMRTHRAWLRDGANNDGKRGVASNALHEFAVPLYDWHPLRPNPLKLLNTGQLAEVFGSESQENRLLCLFRYLPSVVVPRAVVLTVGANKFDPLRRVRALRPRLEDAGFALICGQWKAQRKLAADLGHDLTGAAWVAVPWEQILGHGELSERVIRQIQHIDDPKSYRGRLNAHFGQKL